MVEQFTFGRVNAKMCVLNNNIGSLCGALGLRVALIQYTPDVTSITH